MKLRPNFILAYAWCCLVFSYNKTSAAPLAQDSIRVVLTPQKSVVASTDPLALFVKIQNKGKRPLTVFKPSVLRGSLQFKLFRGTTQVGPILIRETPYIPEEVVLSPQGSESLSYDLSEEYTRGFQAGSYTVVASYQVKTGLVLESNPVSLVVESPTETDNQELDLASKVYQAGEEATIARLGQEFLEKFPNSRFSNQVKLETAFALLKTQKQNQSIALYNQIIESKEPREWVKQEAQNYLWQAYADKGDTAGAIAVLEKFGGLQAQQNIAYVKRLNGKRIFEPPPPAPTEDITPTESINEMDYPKALSPEADLKMTGLLTQWIGDIKGKRTSEDYSNLFANESFQAIQREGANGVRFIVSEVEHHENLGDLPNNDYGADQIMRAVSKTQLHFVPVPTPDNPELKVLRCEEFPSMEVGRHYGQVRQLWLKWWAEKDAKIPVWFRGRYAMWKAAKKTGDKAKTEQLFRRVVDLGIFSLPQWMDKLNTDPQEAKAIIGAISELTSGEIKPDATSAQVNAYWQKNALKWTRVDEPKGADAPKP